MNQTQLRNLQKLVDGDFQNLRVQVNNHITRLYDQRYRELCGGDVGIPVSVVTRVRRMEDKVRRLIDDLRDELGTEGWTTGKSGGYGDAFEFKVHTSYLSNKSVDNRKTALSQARNRVAAQAEAVITRAHLTVNRAILLQGITGSGATEILNNLPNEDSVMTQVTSSLEGYEDDLAILNGSSQA